MKNNTNEFVSKGVLDKVRETFGIKTADRLSTLDDFALLDVYNYCATEVHGNLEENIFFDIDTLNECIGFSPVELAKWVAFGSAEDCFNPDNWLSVESGYIKAITPENRRWTLLVFLCEIPVISDKGKEIFNEALNEFSLMPEENGN